MGDGWLVEFSSIGNGVQCALEVQQALADHERIKLRIGLHVGDVTFEEEDVFGDGVNVASRLQELADPGAVVISAAARSGIDRALSAGFEDMGACDLKNVPEPVAAYGWGMVSPPEKRSEPPLPDKPSIAVLPFENMSGDREQEYFADGIAEDIITALSKISRMRVIARNSAFAYKGKAHDLRQVADDLGVRYILEGSVRTGGRRLRITAQLIDAADGSHIWAERFDRTIDDVFDIQDEISKEIVTALRVKLTDGEIALVWARGTNDVEAWQLCVQATEYFMGMNSTDYLKARPLLERAVELDPNYAQAWATLGYTYFWEGRLGYTGNVNAMYMRAAEIADRAMLLDETASWAIGLSAQIAAPLGRPDEGVEIARRGIELYPGNADVRAFLAAALVSAGAYHEAISHIRAAMSLNPLYPNWYLMSLARALVLLDQLDEALAVTDEILGNDQANILAWILRIYIYGRIGRDVDARNSLDEIRKLAPSLRVGHVSGLLLTNNVADRQRFLDGLAAANFPK
jgi:TolB-like protein/Tfp pilus assembly protein PilF